MAAAGQRREKTFSRLWPPILWPTSPENFACHAQAHSLYVWPLAKVSAKFQSNAHHNRQRSADAQVKFRACSSKEHLAEPAYGGLNTLPLGGEIGQTNPISQPQAQLDAVLFTFLQPFAQNTQIYAWRVQSQLLGSPNLSDSVPAHASYPAHRAAVLCDCAPALPLS